MNDRRAKRVLLIGWDAADWQMIQPIMDRGWMPTLKQFMERGAWGRIATLEPVLSPMLWTSIATGQTADRHGILGFTEPMPDGSGIRPVASTSRRCKALWNILTQSGLRSNVVGWYASHPAEPIRGVCVSNQFEVVTASRDQEWPIPAASVHPPELAVQLADLRVHPYEIQAGDILPFIPNAARLLEKQGPKVGVLRRLLAQVATVHSITTWLMEHTEWDLTAVYYEGIDRFGHEFMQYHPPMMKGIEKEDFDAYHEVMTGIYRFHDMMLERLLQLAGEDTTVLLVSDHGYQSGTLRPDPVHADPTDWHRQFGIVVGAGPGVRQGQRLFGATLLDVTPTVLRLLGLPVGADMAGRPWVEMFDRPLEAHQIISWESVAGDAGLAQAGAAEDPVAAREALQQLVDLGYVDPPSKDVQQTVEECAAWQKVNLVTVLQSANHHAQALATLDQLPERFAKRGDMLMRRAVSLFCLGRLDDAVLVLQTIEDQNPQAPQLWMLRGTIARTRGDLVTALRHYQHAAGLQPQTVSIHERLGGLLLALDRPQEAREAFATALTRDPDSAAALDGLAQVCLESGDPARAVDWALEAVGRVYHMPRAHYHLACGLERVGNKAQALEAVQVCLRQSRRYRAAHELAARLYRDLGQATLAAEQEILASQCSDRSSVVVASQG